MRGLVSDQNRFRFLFFFFSFFSPRLSQYNTHMQLTLICVLKELRVVVVIPTLYTGHEVISS